jgi:hypothetical protein
MRIITEDQAKDMRYQAYASQFRGNPPLSKEAYLKNLGIHGEHVVATIPVSDLKNFTSKGGTAKVQEYARRDTAFPPVHAELPTGSKDGQFVVRDGNHRVDAAKSRGDKTIQVMVPKDQFEKYQQNVAGRANYKTASASANPPMRSITGPETVEASNWQYLTGAKEPPQTITRNGAAVMRTGNPEIARVALDDMRKFAGSKEFKALPKSEQILHRDTLSKLEDQMKDYQKWKAKNPVAPPPGKEPEFEVWLNPGVAGKVNLAKGKMARRVVAHTARAIGQAGIQKTPGKTEDDMKAITAEQERRMSQPE